MLRSPSLIWRIKISAYELVIGLFIWVVFICISLISLLVLVFQVRVIGLVLNSLVDLISILVFLSGQARVLVYVSCNLYLRTVLNKV